MAAHQNAMPRRKCSQNRNGLYVGNQMATGQSPRGNGIAVNAKCHASSIAAAAANHAQANFLGIFTMAPMTATTVSQPNMSKAMYQSGPLISLGKNVEGWVQFKNAKPERMRQNALSIHPRIANTAIRLNANAT